MESIKISPCSITGFERTVKTIQYNKIEPQKLYRITLEVTRYKDKKPLATIGMGPYQMMCEIRNTDESKDYDELLNDSELKTINGIVEWMDKGGKFDL